MKTEIQGPRRPNSPTRMSACSMLPLCTEYPASRKQMMTIDIDTISGVPFTGLLNSTRPTTSAQTQEAQKKCQQRRHSRAAHGPDAR